MKRSAKVPQHVLDAIKIDKGEVSFRPWTAHVEKQQKMAALVLSRMGPDHWEVLEHVFKTGAVSGAPGVATDLMEWGVIRFITKDCAYATPTDAGLIVLESKEW